MDLVCQILEFLILKFRTFLIYFNDILTFFSWLFCSAHTLNVLIEHARLKFCKKKILKIKCVHLKQIFNQNFENGHNAKHLDLCLWVGDRILSNNMILHKQIIFSGESTFSANGIVWLLSVRYTAIGNGIFYFHYEIVTYFLGNTYNRHSYLHMVVMLHVRSARNVAEVRDWLTFKFVNRRMDRNGSILWLLWGLLK